MIKPEDLEWFLKQGINLIPVVEGGKFPSISWKEFQSRKITEEEIEKYFYKSDYNVGAMAGEISNNTVIIDFDRSDLFDMFFPEEKRKGLAIVRSGRKEGGYHVYFRTEAPMYKTFSFKNTEGQEVITVKGSGFCVAPPSIHASGNRYEFVQQPDEIPLVGGNFEEELKRKAVECGLTPGSIGAINILDIFNGVKKGGRDTSLTLLISYLRRQGASQEDANLIVQKWNLKNEPPLEQILITEKVEYHYSLPEAYKYYFETDPKKLHITQELVLESATNISGGVLQSLIKTNDAGHESVNIREVCDYLNAEYDFVAPSDTNELLIYKDGIYISGSSELNVILEQLLGELAPIRLKAEIYAHMRDCNQISRSELNVNKKQIVVENGILDLGSRELAPFSPEAKHTSALSTTYDPLLDASDFEKFISEIVDSDNVQVIQEWFGYCLWQGYPNAKALFLIGDGGNGKSVLTRLLTAFLGLKNTSHLSLSEMDGHHRFATFSLYGKFLNIASEPPTDKALETSLLKLITGENAIDAEQKGVQNRLTFTSFAKIVVEANNIPHIADDKTALWDRLIVINFPNSFRGRENENMNLFDELNTKPSMSGILNWSLDGLARLRANNWQFTSTLNRENAKALMRVVANPVEAFKDQYLTIEHDAETSLQSLFDAFDLFCFVHDISTPYINVLSHEMTKDNRITKHRKKVGGSRIRTLRGCDFSNNIIACYGWYRDRPLRPGELGSIEDPNSDVEIFLCTLQEYMEHYLEPSEEVQEIIDMKMIVFNGEELIGLYKVQKKVGHVRHLSPNALDRDTPKENASSLKPITPLEEGLCEECGKYAFLTHELADEDGKKSLICLACATEIETNMG